MDAFKQVAGVVCVEDFDVTIDCIEAPTPIGIVPKGDIEKRRFPAAPSDDSRLCNVSQLRIALYDILVHHEPQRGRTLLDEMRSQFNALECVVLYSKSKAKVSRLQSQYLRFN